MTIEAQLQELIEINKAILTAIQSGAQVAAHSDGEVTTTSTRKRRTKAEIEADKAAEAAASNQSAPVVAGDPVGTLYWNSTAHALVFAQKPGEQAPAVDAGFVQVSALDYLTAKAAYEKAEAAKNAQAAATQQVAANTAPSATAQQVTASAETSAAGDVSWDQAVAALKELSMNPAHGATAVKAIISQIDPSAANVPALKDLGKNAEIVAAVNALLNPAASTGADPLFG